MTFADIARAPLLRRLPLGAALAWLRDRSDNSLAQRAAGMAFVIRVASAAAAYFAQVVLARWMGGFEFGIYMYVWSWVLLIGDVVHLGLPLAAQRFIPEYTVAKSPEKLRGFIAGASWMVVGFGVAAMVIAAILIRTFEAQIARDQVLPLYIGCLALPFFTLSVILDATARAYNWVNLALMPHFLFRPLVVLALMAIAHLAGFRADATTAMLCVLAATVAMSMVQLVLLDARLRTVVAPVPARYELKHWLVTALPLFWVGAFYNLIAYVDVIILEQFRDPHQVALYYAVARTLLLVSFIYFSVTVAVSPRFAALHAANDRAGLARLVASTVRWTFWPSLGATALMLAFGWPLLWLFGPDFTAAYPLMFILAIGPLARAAVGPAERLLNMAGEQRTCALVYAAAFAVNIVGCFALIPPLGATGAAIAVSAAILFESATLFVAARKRLGLHMFILGSPAR
jgi:O-antigen/teichoic acid export membrane protein